MSGWIGVDFDGTLATYDNWVGWNVFGEPLPRMVNRIRGWLKEGKEVRIVTARIGLPLSDRKGVPKYEASNGKLWRGYVCKITEAEYTSADMQHAIQDWCEMHVKEGWRPIVQCYKDYAMVELWDDRAVQVIPNTGYTLAEEHEAELTALRGAP